MANRLTYGLSTITLKLPIHRPIFNFNSSISFASPLTVDKSPSTTLTPFSKSLGPISTIKIESAVLEDAPILCYHREKPGRNKTEILKWRRIRKKNGERVSMRYR